jgi:hypothetical protein
VLDLLVAEDLVELDDEVLFVGGEGAALEVGAQVVDPPQTAALAAPLQACIEGELIIINYIYIYILYIYI